MSIELEPVAYVLGGRTEPFDDDWSQVTAKISFDAQQFSPDSLQGLAAFSHAEVVFYFDRVGDDAITTDARHPRGNRDWPRVGIFAQRGKNRPNRLGVSVCEIVGVDGLTVTVRGLDAIDGSPVLDLKPVMSGFQVRGAIREPDWARAIMQAYW